MNWELISPSEFEDLCCAYASSHYKDFDWKPTPRSWDGNKDGEFIIEIDSINQLMKGWYESKFTKHPKQSIPHSHMDSTLVSGILDGHVVYILFITNGKITNDFKRRAYAVLHPHRIEVNFVDGDILEEWLIGNPDVYATFFGDDIFNNKMPSMPKLSIEDVCFFDCVLSTPALAEPLRSLSVGNEYFLYIGVRTNYAFECSININTDCLKIYSNNSFNATKFLQIGYNSLLLKCHARGKYQGRLVLKLESNNDCITSIWEQNNFVIQDDFYPKIIYNKQTQAIHQIYDYLQSESTDNTILAVVGEEGSGKSYLHRKLIESLSKDQHESLTIQLSEKKAENACSLCKLILFLNFGYIYKLSEEAFYKLLENSINLPLELFSKLREGSSNQIIALHAINDIIQLLNNKNDYALLPTYNIFMHKSVSYIFIDDVQKLDKEYSLVLQALLSEFYCKKFSQVLILGFRHGEYRDPLLEEAINEKTSKKWVLGKLSQEDIKETLSLEFSPDIGSLSELFPQPVNVLHLVMLVKQMAERKITRLDPLHASKCFAECYKIVNSQNNHFAKHKIETVKHQKELYLIYKIESGLSKNILFDFWSSDAAMIYTELVSQGLIREYNGMVVPFHDAYLYAFQQQNFPSHYINELISLLNYIRKLDKKYPVLESNIISILIAEGNISIPDIREKAYLYCKEYYNSSQYYASKLIAKAIFPDIDSSNTQEYSNDMIEILYIYAQSVKFTESHVESTKLFQKLIHITTKNDITPYTRDIGLDALSEVLNNEMWMLNFTETARCLKKLSYLKITSSTTAFGVNAYLNYLNRKMMCESFTELHDCEESYITAISESVRLRRLDYEAYAKMDRARILYTTYPNKSLTLLYEAKDFFAKEQRFYRRFLECKSEIIFLETLLDDKRFDELYALQKEMLSQGYINSYAKTTLKILTIELAVGAISPETAKIRLNKLILQYPDAIINKRISIAIYQLLSLGAFTDKNKADLIKYSQKHLSIVSNMNKSYANIPEHNLKRFFMQKDISWAINDNLSDNNFWLDPRIW